MSTPQEAHKADAWINWTLLNDYHYKTCNRESTWLKPPSVLATYLGKTVLAIYLLQSQMGVMFPLNVPSSSSPPAQKGQGSRTAQTQTSTMVAFAWPAQRSH